METLSKPRLDTAASLSPFVCAMYMVMVMVTMVANGDGDGDGDGDIVHA